MWSLLKVAPATDCPSMIWDILSVPAPELILYWRDEVVKKGYGQISHNIEQALAEQVLKNAKNLALAEKAGLWALRNLPADAFSQACQKPTKI